MIFQLYGRRRFLHNAALFSAGLVGSIAHAKLTRASDESVTAVVIGSGFGGAVASLRLGQAGIDTVLLERGRRWPITADQNTFATYRNPDGRAAWLSPTTYNGDPVDIYTGILERKDEDGISILCGAGVGGGSLVYSCFMYQPAREQFYLSFPSSIDYEEMAEIYYPRVRSILKPSKVPADILATDYYLSSRVFLEQAANAGLPNRLQDIAVDWNIVREEISGIKRPSAILGENFYGLNSGAKNSLDRNYLAQAEQTGYVEILSLHIVTEITEIPGYGYRVSYNQINESGETIASKFLTCRYLFLAAGSIGTSALLVKAKAKGTLPRLNDYIGQGWATNGDTFGTRSGLPPTNPTQGGPTTTLVEHFDNPYSPIALSQGAQWDAPEGTLSAIGLGIPTERGNFSYDATTDSAKLHWPINALGTIQQLKAAQYTYRILDKRNTTVNYKPTTEVIEGSQRSKNRGKSTVDNSLTVHPLGGAVLGQACDLYGRVKNYQGLYVVDGALMPGSSGCANPAITIAAFAERCMDRIIAEDISGVRAAFSHQL